MLANAIIAGGPEAPEEPEPKLDLPSMERALDELLIRYGLTDAAPELLEALAKEAPGLFFQAGLARLELKDGLPIYRKRSLRLLDTPAFLLRLVCSDHFSTSELKAFCAACIREDPLLDVKLARLMPSRGADEYHLATSSILRILDVLDEVSRGPRLLMIIGHLVCHPDHHVASKAALLIGRRLQNREWVEHQLTSTDPRIRANVAEALWSVNSALAIQTFRRCLFDENNRVYGNALVGLYLRGDRNCSARVRHLAEDKRPVYRQTAAWVMGKVGDPEFVPVLESLLADPAPDVRRSAADAIEKLREQPAPAAGADAPAAALPVQPPETSVEINARTAQNAQMESSEKQSAAGPDTGQKSSFPPAQNSNAPDCQIQLNGRYITGD